MEKSNYLLHVSEAIKQYCNSLKYPENDIRRDFHGMIYDIIYSYYYGYIAYELGELISKGKVMFNEEAIVHKTHIDRMIEVNEIEMLSSSYLSALNKNLLIGAWTSFEVSITIIADAILSEGARNEILENKYGEIMNLLKGINLDENIQNKLRKKLTEGHLTHAPIWRKYNAIVKSYQQAYQGNLSDDIQFIEFYSKMRNAIVHSNCIYYGKDFEYQFKQSRFEFKNGKIFRYNEPKFTPQLYIDLVSELARIFTVAQRLLDDVRFIPYPDNRVLWDE